MAIKSKPLPAKPGAVSRFVSGLTGIGKPKARGQAALSQPTVKRNKMPVATDPLARYAYNPVRATKITQKGPGAKAPTTPKKR